MTKRNLDPSLLAAEVYSAKPVFFITEGSGAVLFGMKEYRAGRGAEPAIGDKVVLSVAAPASQTFRNGKFEENPPTIMLEGIFEVTNAQNGTLASPYLHDAESPEDSYWGVTVRKVSEIEDEAEIEAIESAAVISMM